MKLVLAIIIFGLIGAAVAANAATRGVLTEDMIRTALSSAHISTAPGAELKMLDRRTGQWIDFRLRSFSVRASGHHATIEIDVN
jgi:hypothetical protein